MSERGDPGVVARELARLGSTTHVSIDHASGDNRYEAMYRSWYWLLVLRVALPLLALYTAYSALLELRRTFSSPRVLNVSSSANRNFVRQVALVQMSHFPETLERFGLIPSLVTLRD